MAPKGARAGEHACDSALEISPDPPDPMPTLTRAAAESWLSDYGRAWQARDAAAFAALFSHDVRYHWTPFDSPQQGRHEVGEAFRAAVARQGAVRFDSELLAVTDSVALARWSCSFDRVGADHRVRLDGIFQMEFDEGGLCRVFREWWHSDEVR
jgi:nuclear transport factor 2 (NTF2) superfamily protein